MGGGGGTGRSVDECYECPNVAFDDCEKCGRHACRKHGYYSKKVDKFVCYDCLNEAE